MMTRLGFTVEHTARGTRARAGRLRTAHGEVATPVFMPVGTHATVKAQTRDTLHATGSTVLLANTYHLLLRPGPEVFRRLGGIHRFMQWDGPVLTDSGGFQIFSLPGARVLGEEGASFQSYLDGRTHLLSPESSFAMQQAIGSDITMVLDHCIPATAGRAEAEAALALTHRWADRALRARGDAPQALFGIVQGAAFPDLRQRSAEFLRARPFDGLAIGGLAVGETQAQRYDLTETVTAELPADRPRYLMGVGTPLDLLEAVHRGVDMFDCIIPTQLAQRGTVFTSHGRTHLRRKVYQFAEEPLDAGCDCPTCRTYSRAYLHHLTKAAETLGWHLLGVHNLTFYHRLMRDLRAAVARDEFPAFLARQRELLAQDDELRPPGPPSRPKRRAAAPRLGDYEVHETPAGHACIRQLSSGEVMHPVGRPDEEAELLYIGQAALGPRLRVDGADAAAPELVVWDVGLGAATNAMAAVRCCERELAAAAGAGAAGVAGARAVRLVSFERDLDSLRLTVREAARFPHAQHGAPSRLLATGRWAHASGRLTWELVPGDFAETFAAAPTPDLVFYDPFSAKTDTPLWSQELFARLRAHWAAQPVELYTYSAATAVRVALLAAGFHVAEGVGTGPKEATTLAFTRADGAAAHPGAPRLLDGAWLARWRRSAARFPAGLPAADQPAFAARIEAHPQFAGTAGVS